MSCLHPLRAFDTGLTTDSGKPFYVIHQGQTELFNLKDAEKKAGKALPTSKIKIINGNAYLADPIPIPCGSCAGCRMDRAKEWKVRCCLEAALYEHNSFITLTYDNEHLPSDKLLVKKDLQDFFKRLRYYCGDFRYFACGEYGEITRRPHYHALLFGLHFRNGKFYKLVNGRPYFTDELLSKAWPKGLAIAGAVDSGSISYVTGYVEKKQVDHDWFNYKVKPFSLMSRKPGIGSIYYYQARDGFARSPYCYGDFGNTHKYKLPRFFLSKLEKDFPEVYQELKRRRKARGLIASDMQSAEFCGASDDAIARILEPQLLASRLRKDKL